MFLRGAILIALMLLVVSYASASTYLSLDDEVYDSLLRLEANGIIQSGLLSTKPLSRAEIVRLILEAEGNSEGRSPFIRQEVRLLKQRFEDDLDGVKYIKPLDHFNISYIYADGDPEEFVYNNDGDIYKEGSNFRLELFQRGELGWFSFYINPELRREEDDTDGVLQRGYAVFSLSNFDLQIGKDSQWWGPGHHGSLLLSNNAEPLPMIRLSNPKPFLLPWIFRPLGLFQFVYFVTQLEEDRAVPRPILWGLRVSFKLSPYLEVGLQRTALLGGEGRSEDLKTWWKSFTGRNEDDLSKEAGDQRAGYDVKVTLPFHWQPLQLYLEAAGEDMGGRLPSKWAYLAGFYLPKVLVLERFNIRAEYATNHIGGEKRILWYTHGVYASGYTFNGRIIGHHMGPDSRDLFFEIDYRLPKWNGKIKVALDKEEHNISGASQPSETAASIGFKVDAREDLSIEGTYTFGKIRNAVGSDDQNINLFFLTFRYFL